MLCCAGGIVVVVGNVVVDGCVLRSCAERME